jgi:DegV family protein with EDD domain
VAARTAIVTDSTADLVPELAARHAITVVPLTVNLDGRSYLDGVDITAAEFYDKLRASSAHPTTSQPSAGQFKEAYERLLEDHEEIVSLHISAKLSGTQSSARQAAEMVGPDRVKVLDSEFVSMPLASLALVAALRAERGGDASEIIEDVWRVRASMRCFFAVSTLEFLRRGGRIGSASALLGSVLQIKPILSIEAGEVAPLERVRTHDRAMGRLVKLGRAVDRAGGLCVVIGHAAAEDAAIALAERLEDLAETLIVQPLGPVVGAHAGPGTVGLSVYPAELFPLGLGNRLAAGAFRS